MDLTENNRDVLKVTNAEYTTESGSGGLPQPIVHLYCRDENGTKRRVDVEGFRPYFYMQWSEFVERYGDVINDRHVMGVEADLSGFDYQCDDLDTDDFETPYDVAGWLTADASGDTKVYHNTDVARALDGTRVVKVITIEPAHVGKIREHWDRTWEADVPFERRFLISSEIYRGISVPEGATRVRYENYDGYSGSEERIQEIRPADPPDVDPRMLVVDIEVATHGGGVPSVTDAPNEVTAITAYDNYTESYTGWILAHESWDVDLENADFEDAVSEKLDIDLSDMDVYENEAKLLEDFNMWVNRREPDILTAWNADFDYPYLINRSYNVSAYSIREWDDFGNPGAWESEQGNLNTKIDGLVVWDSLEAYEKTQFRDLDSYALEAVASEELGMGKAEIEDDLDDAWHDSPIDFMVYNVRDVQAVVEIEQQSELIELFENLREVTGASYTTCYNNGPMLDTMFLRQAFEDRLCLPTNEPVPPEEGNYPGAKVFEPVPGQHDNCVYPDLACFTPDHEVVTPEGIVNITDLDVGDGVYSIDPDTQEVTIKPVIETHEYPEYSGETVSFSSSSVDIEVTPNHNMLLDDGFDEEYEFIEAGNIEVGDRYSFAVGSAVDRGSGIDSIDITEYLDSDKYDVLARYDCHGHHFRSELPDGCTKKRANYHEGFVFDGETFESYQNEIESLSTETLICHPECGGSTFRPYRFDGDAFISLLGWFITEGNVYHPDGSNTSAVKIAQEGKHRDDVLSVFDSLGLDPSVDEQGYTIGSKIYGDLLESICGSGSENKKVPDLVFEDASVEQKELLLDILMKGDGSKNIYYTISDQLKEDVVRLAFETGKTAWYENRRGTWEIHIRENRSAVSNESDVSETETDDGVYCVTVEDNHTLLAGRNGKFQWVGQSMYPNLFAMLNLGNETVIGDEDDFKESGYSEDEVFTFPCDPRGFKEVPKGESYDNIDKDKYKGVLSSDGGLREMFEPIYEKRYVLKPEVKESFLRSTIDDLIDLKYDYSGKKYSAIKRVTNSVYGVAGDSSSGGVGFRLFNRHVAEGITLAGRLTIQFTANEFTEYLQDNYDEDAFLVGGDTDSCVSSIPNAPTLGHAKEWSEEAIDHVEEGYDEFVKREFDFDEDDEHRLAVELESLASGLFYSQDMDADNPEDDAVKKRYAQHIVWDDDDGWLDLPDDVETEYDVLEDPEDRSELKEHDDVTYETYDTVLDGEPEDDVEITGFEYVRSDSAVITRESQLKVLSDILLAEEPADEIYEYLSDYVDRIKSGEIENEKIGRRKGINNDLDDYGWKSVEELEGDSNYEVTETDEERGGRYVATPGPTYRGAKYADEHIPWEDISAGSKPMRFYVDSVRGTKFPPTYQYDSYPKDDKRDDPPEVDREVDAIAVDDPSRIPIEFELDREKMIHKELEEKLQGILRTIGEDWDGLVGEGRQSGLDQWT